MGKRRDTDGMNTHGNVYAQCEFNLCNDIYWSHDSHDLNHRTNFWFYGRLYYHMIIAITKTITFSAMLPHILSLLRVDFAFLTILDSLEENVTLTTIHFA